MKFANTEERFCVICWKKFLRKTKRNSHRNPPRVRQMNARTCSKKCSKIHVRNSNSGKGGKK